MKAKARSHARAAALLLLACAFTFALPAAAAVLKLGLVTVAGDERFDAKRGELRYPGHPAGPPKAAVEVAIAEGRFELEAAKLEVQLADEEVDSEAALRAAVQKAERGGAAALLLDAPPAWIAAAAGASPRLVLVNIGRAEDTLRGAGCRANLWHTLPSERMRTDALAQWLVQRRWARVLVLQGPRAEDAVRGAGVAESLRRYGLKVVATKPFKLSADPRERDLANPLLLTGGSDHDVVWVVDSDGEFARSLPYRTALPRPVVGDGGLTAQAWAPHFERFGAPQLARRFARAAGRPMTGHDWAAWIGTKAVLQAAMQATAGAAAPGKATAGARTIAPADIAKALADDTFVLDGFKGTRTTFRRWDRQLRQPMLLTDGVGVVGSAPVEGILHPKNTLDTLGADERESACR
jgi:ABC transporter substrate binding protein (PQQ-dependent alcohol dehydrogenase system)